MKNMKKLSLLQKSASLTKAAISPWGMNPDNNRGSNPIWRLSGGSSKPSKPAVPAKLPSPLNISIATPALASNFNSVDLSKLSKRNLSRDPQLPSMGEIAYLNNLEQLYTLGEYIRQFPPTPAGVPYRIIYPIYNSNGFLDNVNAYTDLLNESGLYPEKLSNLSSANAKFLSRDILPKLLIYLVDGRDGANWMYNRRGLKLTDEMWDRMNKARLDVTSQLHKMPLTIYHAWTNNDKDVNAYSIRFNGYKNKHNLHLNVFNPKYFDLPYKYSPYSGFTIAEQDGLLLEPWERFMKFLDFQDHELSHAFNDTTPITLFIPDEEEIWDGEKKIKKDNMFFRRTNNPELPYYDDFTTLHRRGAFHDLFNNTYLERPSEYIGAMARVKRYGAELGLDTTSSDPATARAAMAQTLHYLATHPKPEELSPELQRINSWLNTAAGNHMRLPTIHRWFNWGTATNLLQYYPDGYKADEYAIKDSFRNNLISEEEYEKRLKLNVDAHKANYLKNPESPFYRDVLEAMTDATIQGLVRNDVPSNNTMALNNLRYNYA